VKKLRRFLGPALVVVAAFFLVRALVDGWSEARAFPWQFDVPRLALSVALLCVYYVQQWGGWRLIMKGFGDPLTTTESAAIWSASTLGRYVPGKVAMIAGRISLCRKHGIPARATFASMVYENALILITALLVAAASVPLWPPFPLKNYALLLAALAPVGIALLHPKVLWLAANWGLRRLKREPLEETLHFGRVLLLVPYYAGGWVLLGLAFAALAAAITPVGWGAVPLLVGGYAFAWEVGFLSFVTPSGLGVKEAILAVVLALTFPPPVAAALVVLSRLWQTLAEIALTALVWAYARISTRRTAAVSNLRDDG
jgi:uncharacterized membrane protein YbhN (UPF0104 family)